MPLAQSLIRLAAAASLAALPALAGPALPWTGVQNSTGFPFQVVVSDAVYSLGLGHLADAGGHPLAVRRQEGGTKKEAVLAHPGDHAFLDAYGKASLRIDPNATGLMAIKLTFKPADPAQFEQANRGRKAPSCQVRFTNPGGKDQAIRAEVSYANGGESWFTVREPALGRAGEVFLGIHPPR